MQPLYFSYPKPGRFAIKRFILFLILALCFSGIAPFAHAQRTPGVLFINVGDADAALIMTETQNFLVDTGRKKTAPQVLAALEKMGVVKLDGVFLTHSHSDHVGGLKEIAQNIPIDTAYCAAIGEQNKKWEMKTPQAIRKAGLEPVLLQAGDQVQAGDALFEVLGPLREDMNDDNDNSLVLRLRMQGASFLLAGDMQFVGEQVLLNAGTDLKADILKVGNHGNRDATSPAFARAVSPLLAVISADTTADDNSAHPQVMKTLAPAQILVTQQAKVGILVQAQEGQLSYTLLQE